MKCNLRRRTSSAFKSIGANKPTKTETLLGASYLTVKKHIGLRFTDGMTWGNYGGWHVDHIIPFASAKDSNEVIALCHYTNLQPLWAEDNLSKGAKIDNEN